MPVFNAEPYLGTTLPRIVSAARAYPKDIDLVAVDNGSTDGSRGILESFSDDTTIIDCPDGNVGRVRNVGVHSTTGEYVVFLDADCIVAGNYFLAVAASLSKSGAHATGSTVALPESPGWIEQTWSKLHRRQAAGRVSYINSGNFICAREALETVGGFDEALESGEDAELCQRLSEAGFSVYEDPKIVARHLGNPKSLSQFFQRQIWHGAGALGTAKSSRVDKPLTMTIAHACTAIIGIALAAATHSLAGATLGLAGLLAVPIMAVLYRMVNRRTVVNPVSATILYFLYFSGRAVALAKIAYNAFASGLDPRRKGRAHEETRT